MRENLAKGKGNFGCFARRNEKGERKALFAFESSGQLRD